MAVACFLPGRAKDFSAPPHTCVLDFVLCLSSDHYEFMAVLMVFNWWTDPGLIFEHCSKFLIFNSHFSVTTLGLDLFSGAYRNNLLFMSFAVIENSST